MEPKKRCFGSREVFWLRNCEKIECKHTELITRHAITVNVLQVKKIRFCVAAVVVAWKAKAKLNFCFFRLFFISRLLSGTSIEFISFDVRLLLLLLFDHKALISLHECVYHVKFHSKMGDKWQKSCVT